MHKDMSDADRIADLKKLGYAGYMGGRIDSVESYEQAGLKIPGAYTSVI